MICAMPAATAGVVANWPGYLFSEMPSGVCKNGYGRNTRIVSNEKYGAIRQHVPPLYGYA
jgi:hypothetical protein